MLLWLRKTKDIKTNTFKTKYGIKNIFFLPFSLFIVALIHGSEYL